MGMNGQNPVDAARERMLDALAQERRQLRAEDYFDLLRDLAYDIRDETGREKRKKHAASMGCRDGNLRKGDDVNHERPAGGRME
jgi:hypothetical protein